MRNKNHLNGRRHSKSIRTELQDVVLGSESVGIYTIDGKRRTLGIAKVRKCKWASVLEPKCFCVFLVYGAAAVK